LGLDSAILKPVAAPLSFRYFFRKWRAAWPAPIRPPSPSGANAVSGRASCASRFRSGRRTPLVRDVATALGDPARESETRAILRERIVTPRSGGLKALLASAPLEGIDLDRPRDFGRDVSL